MYFSHSTHYCYWYFVVVMATITVLLTIRSFLPCNDLLFCCYPWYITVYVLTLPLINKYMLTETADLVNLGFSGWFTILIFDWLYHNENICTITEKMVLKWASNRYRYLNSNEQILVLDTVLFYPGLTNDNQSESRKGVPV